MNGTARVRSPSDEAEFVAAIDRYKREQRRPFPTWSEVLAVLRSLGYQRDTGPGRARTE